jgi:RNA polymerase sigma-70 factor (ECF subfamily)
MVYDQFLGFACKLVFRYVYRYDKAIDVVNDGFVKVFSHFDQFILRDDEDLEKYFMGWMKRIMINCAIDELRKNNMMPEIGRISDDVWNLPDNSYDADRQLRYRDLMLLVKSLPPNYRVVFNMYVIDGYTHPEIAEMLGISVGTSKSSLSRARTILQKNIRMKEESVECRI